jgi:hypothetical protein
MVHNDRRDLAVPIAAGAAAALAGAIAWALFTQVTGWKIGFLALGIGALVGTAMNRTLRRPDATLGVVGAVLALAGCVLGDLFIVDWELSKISTASFFDYLQAPDRSFTLLMKVMTPMDYLFWGLSAYAGFRYSQRPRSTAHSAPPLTHAAPETPPVPPSA